MKTMTTARITTAITKYDRPEKSNSMDHSRQMSGHAVPAGLADDSSDQPPGLWICEVKP
jgi:hypothetical protein